MDLTELQSTFIVLTLATCFLIIGRRRLGGVISVVAAQAVVLAGVTLIRGWSTGLHEMYVAAMLTLLIKAGAIPYILNMVITRIGKDHRVKAYLPMKMSFVVCAGLVILAFWVSGQTVGFGEGSIDIALPAAIAMVLIGLYLMITRKLAINQVVGIVVMENGVFLAGIGTANGMPAVVELGIFLDILVGVLIMGILVFRINRAFDTINTESLRNLRG